GRIGAPFYVLFAAHVMPLTGPHGGANLGQMSLLLFLGDSLSNMIWGTLGDRLGFRTTFIGAMILWVAATVVLLLASSPPSRGWGPRRPASRCPARPWCWSSARATTCRCGSASHRPRRAP